MADKVNFRTKRIEFVFGNLPHEGRGVFTDALKQLKKG